jgi:hypothetical protein
MPRISEFFGIVIYMYWFDQAKHKVPHFMPDMLSSRLSLTLKAAGSMGPLVELEIVWHASGRIHEKLRSEKLGRKQSLERRSHG